MDGPRHPAGDRPQRQPESDRQRPATTASGPGHDAQTAGTPRRPLISVVDDDESVREALESLLRSAGFKAEVFASAEQFLRSDRAREVDCLIVDVRMPGMNGLELQRQLAADGSRVPIIFITAHGDEIARAQALRAGAVAFLRKPFSEQALLDAVQAVL
jgi:FixJ family two-component response regulator